METAIKIVVGIFVAIVMVANLKSCSDCYEAGGTPVKGVVVYACIKK